MELHLQSPHTKVAPEPLFCVTPILRIEPGVACSPYGTPPPRPSYENMPPMSHYSGSPYGTPPRPPPYTPPGPRY
ncbi:hypothetical protein AMTR_s00003p00269500 [Amborella trichopoda]|uniref:Uncharacterized protein n=1 Tax=Amborella trichopoda TaxID=13333 RepID=W1P0W9_AMBTC|nr:hypothetical protein AMTR_s00003p00269500 [Amborella trichopoda]